MDRGKQSLEKKAPSKFAGNPLCFEKIKMLPDIIYGITYSPCGLLAQAATAASNLSVGLRSCVDAVGVDIATFDRGQ